MKVIVIKHPKNTKNEDVFGYKFFNGEKSCDYLFRNYGNVGVNGVLTVDPPEEIIEWFKDIQGDDNAIAAEYDLKRANDAVEKCNKKLGCSATCDFDKKRKCDLLTEQTLRQEEKELTKAFMNLVLESGFTEIMNPMSYNLKYKKG